MLDNFAIQNDNNITTHHPMVSFEPYAFCAKTSLKGWLKGEFKLASIFRTHENTSDYEVGSWDVRSWGYYMVTSVRKQGDTVTECQKDIGVFPKQMLSLQAHKGRDEKWTVKEGTLTVIINGEAMLVQAGQSVELKAGDIHCMINMTDKIVKVHEVQSGVCEEVDNMRLMDFGGRATVDYDHPMLDLSKQLYRDFMDQMPQNIEKMCFNVGNTVRTWKHRTKFLAKKVV